METSTGENLRKHLLSALGSGSEISETSTQFRVIGKSHDDRMIPMLEIGTGDTMYFLYSWFFRNRLGRCRTGLRKQQWNFAGIMSVDGLVQEFYEVRKLLDHDKTYVLFR